MEMEVFRQVVSILAFDVPGLTIIVYQWKQIENSYLEYMFHADLFLNPLHMKKNMAPRTGFAQGFWDKTI